MEQNVSPRRMSGTNEASPAGTNCGRRLVKNAAIFGFPRLLTSPCRAATGGARPPLPPISTACAEPRHAARSVWSPR
jgi:hypothetical protein